MKRKTIENWAVIYTPGIDQYTPPECIHQHLLGHVDGDTSKRRITTAIEGKCDGQIVTRNSLYALGTPDTEYAAKFPNPKDRLMATLPEVTPCQ